MPEGNYNINCNSANPIASEMFALLPRAFCSVLVFIRPGTWVQSLPRLYSFVNVKHMLNTAL